MEAAVRMIEGKVSLDRQLDQGWMGYLHVSSISETWPTQLEFWFFLLVNLWSHPTRPQFCVKNWSDFVSIFDHFIPWPRTFGKNILWMEKILHQLIVVYPIFFNLQPSKVVQDFCHPPYFYLFSLIINRAASYFLGYQALLKPKQPKLYPWLVVWLPFFIFPYIWNNHPNWLIFFRGVETTNQYTPSIPFCGQFYRCQGMIPTPPTRSAKPQRRHWGSRARRWTARRWFMTGNHVGFDVFLNIVHVFNI